MPSTPRPDPSRPSEWTYAPKPTRRTVFLRTFLPWQAWQFVRINMRMFRAIAKSHH
jgi:hypothetical protein